MKKIYLIVIILFFLSPVWGQTKLDYNDYIKTTCVASNGISVYNNIIVFKKDLDITDVNFYTGKSLSNEQYESFFAYGIEVYSNSNKTDKLFEVVRSCDLRGIRKVATNRKSNSDGYYYQIIIYLDDAFYCTEWASVEGKVKPIDEIAISIKDNKTTANNVKKAFLELAKLHGAKNVIDGDNLFGTD